MTVFVAITGASGAVYAARALETLGRLGADVWATVSPTGAEIIRHELGVAHSKLGASEGNVTW